MPGFVGACPATCSAQSPCKLHTSSYSWHLQSGNATNARLDSQKLGTALQSVVHGRKANALRFRLNFVLQIAKLDKSFVDGTGTVQQAERRLFLACCFCRMPGACTMWYVRKRMQTRCASVGNPTSRTAPHPGLQGQIQASHHNLLQTTPEQPDILHNVDDCNKLWELPMHCLDLRCPSRSPAAGMTSDRHASDV